MNDRPQSAAPVVDLSDIVCLVNGFPALSGLDLQVDQGEIVLVRGPNGAGKSTLMRLLAGLIPPAQGHGTVFGFDLTSTRERRPLRRQVGLLAHESFLYDELTVAENVEFWARANRVDEGIVEAVLDRLELSGRLRNVRVSGLSAGQRRRTSLAVMVSRRPRLWLLDEPHAGLDANGRTVVDQLMTQAADSGATVVLASHDQDRAARIATRTVTLVGGRVHEEADHAP